MRTYSASTNHEATEAGEDSKMQKLQAAVEPTGPSRFIGHQHSSKYGRSWGKYNPVHVPIIDGIEDVELELSVSLNKNVITSDF